MEKMDNKTILTGQVPAEQIEAWKKQYRNVYAIVIDEKVCYLKKPGRKEMSYAASIGPSDPMGMVEAIITTCWLGGCEEIRTDEELFLAAVSQVQAIVETKQAELVKL